MTILVTGDFQADYQNLDLCQRAWDEIIEICLDKSISQIVVAGDLKQVYNPVDARVIKWWFKAAKRAQENNIEVLANLGNHDRLGLYVSTDNWFPILRKAGVKCFDKPTRYGNLAFLPYRSSEKILRQDARQLAESVGNENVILIFHGEVKGAKYNQFGQKADSGIEADWLFADRYSYCIGGHFHLQQQIGKNIFYCGSPFAQDWGEANQRKGYIVTDGRRVEAIPSSIPGWYDPTWPNFIPPKTWDGARLRIHIECSSPVAYLREVESAREAAARLYQGAEIDVSATIRNGQQASDEFKLSISDPDQIKIREYIKQTCPENISLEKVETYLCSKLEQQSGRWRRTGTGVTFVKATAKNFLSFTELEVAWEQKGIIVVQGKNLDRNGKSNGSGKTSLLQTIPVALFGSTFKGQKHDRWAKRGGKAPAEVILTLRDGKNRTITISRSRKPSRLRLWVDGKEQSTGMKPQDKDGTQTLIEKLTGFTWQTLANAVYIDQDIAYQFIAGTKKSRTDVLSKIQNLERFEKALKTVKKDRTVAEVWAQQVEENISVLQERIDGCKKKLQLLDDESTARLDGAYRELEKRRKAKERNDALLKPRLEFLKVKVSKAQKRFEQLSKLAGDSEWALQQWKTKRQMILKQRPELDATSNVCPTCKQAITQAHLDAVDKKIKADLASIKPAILSAQESYTKALNAMNEAEVLCESLNAKYNSLVVTQNVVDIAFTECERNYVDLKQREHMGSQRRETVKEELATTLTQKKAMLQHQQYHKADLQFYEYCEKSFSRDGIPAFLNALLCPTLNLAAEYYAEIFADKALQVRFELEDGEFVPVVLNATGGESIEDQSEGERALAGLIASFALRETSPHCNLLILDEPGNGLDPSSARQFAKGLRSLLSKFDGIWLTTHNSAIASELVDQQIINVIKKNGVSNVG